MLGLNPYYSEKFLFNKVSMAGIIIFLTSLQDLKEYILGKYHFFMFYLALSMYPKMLFTVLVFSYPDQRQIRVAANHSACGSSHRRRGPRR